jgi:peptidoglycan hydrolase-like protein with peptidoglycan-binding domain
MARQMVVRNYGGANKSYGSMKNAPAGQLGLRSQNVRGLRTAYNTSNVSGVNKTGISPNPTGVRPTATGAGQGSGNRPPGAGKNGMMAGRKWPGYRGRRWGWLGPVGPIAPAMSSDWVSWAQACLGRLVGPGVPQDGAMGPETVRAIQMFQTQSQLPVTGMLDSGTTAALQAACSRPAAEPPAPPPPPPGPQNPPSSPADEPPEEMEEFAQAAELMAVTNEQELDHFLGDLISDIGKAASGYAGSAASQTMGGILKSTAKQVLPVLSRVLSGDGSILGGTGIGRPFMADGDNVFGQELGEMSHEEREFEHARRYVKFARHAVKRATEADPDLPPAEQAKAAVIEAAKQFAPGLTDAAQAIVTGAEPPVVHQQHHRQSGKWFRKGKDIVLQGL